MPVSTLPIYLSPAFPLFYLPTSHHRLLPRDRRTNTTTAATHIMIRSRISYQLMARDLAKDMLKRKATYRNGAPKTLDLDDEDNLELAALLQERYQYIIETQEQLAYFPDKVCALSLLLSLVSPRIFACSNGLSKWLQVELSRYILYLFPIILLLTVSFLSPACVCPLHASFVTSHFF